MDTHVLNRLNLCSKPDHSTLQGIFIKSKDIQSRSYHGYKKSLPPLPPPRPSTSLHGVLNWN